MTQWQKVRIGDLFNLEKGRLQSSKCTSGKYDFITAGKHWKTHNEYTHTCEALVIAVAASGSLGRTHYINGKFVSSDLCFILTPKNEEKYPLNLSFYHFVFNSLRKTLVAATKSGTSKEAINQKNFKKYEIPYFDIKQQSFWIEKLKNTQTQKELLNKELIDQQILLKKLRQQILQEAIEGKLTQDWRVKNPNTEPASELLKRIQAEKQQLIKDKKIKAQKPLPAISEDEKPFKLPDRWVWCRLGGVMQFNPRNKLKDDLNVSFIPMRLISGGFKNEHKSEIKQWLNVKNGFTHFSENDVVISKITPCFQNRKSAVLKNILNKYGAGTTELHVLRSYNKTIISEYILFLVKTNNFINKGVLTYKGTVGQQRVQKSFIENYIVPLPPFYEQKTIVAKVEKLFRICDKLEVQITANQTYAEQLMQAVLKEAFTQPSQSVELPKPEEKAFLKRKMMAAYIVNQSLEDKNFGNVKFEKMLYLSDCLLQRNFNQQYFQKAAGPYDNKFTYPFFNQMQKSKWFKKQRNGTLNRIVADKNVAKSQDTYNYFSTEELDKIDWIIKLFKKTDYEKPEIVATLYAVWNNRIINKQPINDELLKADFLAWSEEKIKYQERIFKALDWMRKENIIPNGWGKLINKPKSKG